MKNNKLTYGRAVPVLHPPEGEPRGRRTEITIETREIKTIRIRSSGATTYCDRCGVQAASYTPEHVAVFLGLDLSEVMRSIETGQVHVIVGAGDVDEICGNSLGGLIDNSDASAEPESVENTVRLLKE